MKSNFQIITLVVFIAAAVLGVFVFSGAIPLGNSGSGSSSGTVVLWGTIKSQTISPLIENFNRSNTSFSLKYEEKSSDTFDSDLLESLASGTGPDMFLLPDNLVYKYSNKVYVIPYQSVPLSSFRNTFVEAGEVFLNSKGVLALPLAVDPMVMYYNRNMLDSNGITSPPMYWDEFANLVPVLTQKDQNGSITKSTVALGQFSNISNAKEILASLFMQSGDPIISENNGEYVSLLSSSTTKYDPSSVLKFYTDFADPLKTSYSWNKSFPSSSDAFSAEELAFYFGFASELPSLINKNPNQNFSVASFPQVRNANFKLTFAHTLGIAISSFSKNQNTAITAAGLLASGDFASKLASSLGIAPARRDLLKSAPTDAYSPTFYSSALYGRSFMDPSPKDTNDIFSNMIEKVLSGSMTPEQALRDASAKLGLLLTK